MASEYNASSATCRLMITAKELKATSKSLTEVSERSGYDSAYSFSRVFKSMLGTPPGAYRKSARRQDPKHQ